MENWLRFVVGLLAETVKLLGVSGVTTLCADKLSQRLAHVLCDTDTVTVEPIIAKVTADVEPGTTQSHLGTFKPK